MTDELESAERLMGVLETEYAGQISGAAEYVAMRALAGDAAAHMPRHRALDHRARSRPRAVGRSQHGAAA